MIFVVINVLNKFFWRHQSLGGSVPAWPHPSIKHISYVTCVKHSNSSSHPTQYW